MENVGRHGGRWPLTLSVLLTLAMLAGCTGAAPNAMTVPARSESAATATAGNTATATSGTPASSTPSTPSPTPADSTERTSTTGTVAPGPVRTIDPTAANLLPLAQPQLVTSVRYAGGAAWNWTPKSLSLHQPTSAFVVTASALPVLTDLVTGRPTVLRSERVTTSHGPAILQYGPNDSMWPDVAVARYWLSWELTDGGYLHLALPYSNGHANTWNWRADEIVDRRASLPTQVRVLKAPEGFSIVGASGTMGEASAPATQVTLCRAARSNAGGPGCIRVEAFGPRQSPYGRTDPARFENLSVDGTTVEVSGSTGRAIRHQGGGSLVVSADLDLELSDGELAGIAAATGGSKHFLATGFSQSVAPVVADGDGTGGSPDLTDTAPVATFPLTPTSLPADVRPSRWVRQGSEFTLTYTSRTNPKRVLTISNQPDQLGVLDQRTVPAAPPVGPSTVGTSVPPSWPVGPESGCPDSVDPGFCPPPPPPTMATTLADGTVAYVGLTTGTRTELEATVDGLTTQDMPAPAATIGPDRGVTDYGRISFSGPASAPSGLSLCPQGEPSMYGDFAVEISPRAAFCITVVVSSYDALRDQSAGNRPGHLVAVELPDGRTMHAVIDSESTIAQIRLGPRRFAAVGLPIFGGVAGVEDYLPLLATSGIPGL